MAKRQSVPDPAATQQPDAKTLMVQPHVLHTAFSPVWTLLAHVREGTGGFLDGTYLIAHPREWEDHTAVTPQTPTKKLKARRSLACYENIAGAIMEAKRSALFRETPSRRFTSQKAGEPTGDAAALQAWWDDVDGCGTCIDDFMASKWDIAGTFGHLFIYMDRPKGVNGATAADALSPFLRVYTPLDAVNWTVDDRGRLKTILFREPSETANGRFTYRYVTDQHWAWYDESLTLKEGGPVEGLHQMGVLPVVPLFAKRRSLYRFIGQSVLGDPKVYQDLYNLTSEIRELLRAQTFSFINVPLGTGDQKIGIEEAKEMLGTQIGSSNVLFSGLSAQMLSGDANNVLVYHKEYDRRIRTAYRTAGVQWEADSRDAEATGSLKLKREDMNTRLAAYADEVEKADYKIAELWFRAVRGDQDGMKAYENAALEIRYPDNFDVTPFDVVLEQAKAALALDFPQVVMNEILKSLVSKFLPDMDSDEMKKLLDAIDQREPASSDVTMSDALRTRLMQVANGNTSAMVSAQDQADIPAA